MKFDQFDDKDYERAQARYVPITSITPASPRWYWRERLVQGDLNILAGTQGVGKSQIAMSLAAEATRRGDTVLVISAEDSPTTTIAPRFIAAGGDPQDASGVPLLHVRRMDADSFTLADADTLREDITMLGAQFVIIDPVAAFVTSKTDTYKDRDVRAALAPLREMCEATDCTVLLVMHLKKGSEGEAVNRVGGSIAWTAAPRSVLMVHRQRDVDTGDVRRLHHVKCNVGPEQPAIEFEVEAVPYGVLGPFTTSVVKWGSEVDNDLTFDTPDMRRDKPAPKLDQATAFLRGALASGPVPTAELDARASHDGISDRTLRRAKSDLGVVTERDDFQGPYTSRLPQP